MLLPSTARDCRSDLPRFQPNERYSEVCAAYHAEHLPGDKSLGGSPGDGPKIETRQTNLTA